jgi:hypothetical protein
VALGAVVALRPVVKRRMVRKMRCKQMMGQLIGGSETTADAAMGPEAMPPKMREHCKQTAAQHEQRREPSRRPSRRS